MNKLRWELKLNRENEWEQGEDILLLFLYKLIICCGGGIGRH
jgi:hypothetical protein